jgi:uncharacterized RDD family membrane protein YckC
MNEQPLPAPQADTGGVPDVWRDEVQARLERYKRRRGRSIEGAFTMRFPFPPQEADTAVDDAHDTEPIYPAGINQDAAPQTSEPSPTVPQPASDAGDVVALEAQPPASELQSEESAPPSVAASAAPLFEPEREEEPPLIELPPRPMPRRKVIAFPSPSYAEREAFRRIADPVQPEQLRILDVPEELQAISATPFLEGLLDAPPAPSPELRGDAVELPCATLHANRRLGAACIDAAVTLAGAALFVAAAAKFLPDVPPTKFLIAGTAAVCVLLWVTYQYLFLVYQGRTPGMTATRVRLQTFKGHFPRFRQRQLRVVGLFLSVLPLGMGVLWYFVDAESLCWHDRISQTFPAAADKS